MIYSFKYLAPTTREELHSILAHHGSEAALLSGGTDLLVNIRNGVSKPKCVVNVKKVQGFSGISWSNQEGLIIRTGATINDLLREERVRKDFPILAACAHDLASYQIRNRATVIGNVANASPCSDLAPALLCLKARAVISSKRGEREVPFQEFFQGVKKTVLLPDEILERIVVPAFSAGAQGDYRKLKRINGHDLAIVGVAMFKQNGVLRMGISSAAPTPIFVGDLKTSDPAESVIASALKAISPISDVRCTKEYREHMVRVFVGRLLEEVKE
jgi:CO/xanthine dehydrogenase FAD-binding subunit